MSEDLNKLSHGVFWNAVQKYSGLVVSTVVSMVLARLLSPEEFGIIAIASVIISFLTMLSDMGIAPAVIQRKDLTENDINNIFTFSCIIGLVFAILFFFASWGISSFYDKEVLVPVCQILSIQVFFAAANMVPNALMAKNFRFKEIAKRTLLLQILTGILAIIAAFLGSGVYALLISPIVTSIGIYLYNHHYYKVSIQRHFSLSPIKRIFSYSAFQFLFQIVTYFAGNIDKLIIGKNISASDLGYYQKAYQLVQAPLGSLGAIFSPVLHPLLSKYQDDKELLSEKYSKIVHILAMISFPIGLFFCFSGTELIRFFYGSKWDMAIPSFCIMSITIPFQIMLSTIGSFFQAGNETKRLFYLGFTNGIVAITLILIAAVRFHTIESVAMAYCISSIFAFADTLFFIFVIVLKGSFLKVIKEFSIPILIALPFALFLYLENRYIAAFPVLNFVVKGVTTLIITYVALQKSGLVDLNKKCHTIIKKYITKNI